MQKEEISAYIIKELAKSRKPNDVVLGLCEKTGMQWAEAAQLVKQVRASSGQEIAARQSPILILFSALLLLFGIGLVFAFLFVPIISKSSVSRLLLGIGMILGGIIGLWNTLASFFKAK